MKILTTSLLALVLLMTTTFAAPAPENVDKIFNTLLNATISGDFVAFQDPGNEKFRSGITEEMFRSVSQQVSPLLRDGYTAEYLTALKQGGFDVYVWKVTPKAGGDEFLARLVVSDGKAAGFWLQ